MKGFIKRDKLLITEDFERAVLGKELADFAEALQPSLLWYQSFYDACSQEFASQLPEQSEIPPRLGLYFEWLWIQALQCHPDYQLLGSNIQIQHDGRTLGSLDLLVLDTKTDTVEHWELACKFYLCYRDGQKEHWLGPNLNDYWEYKKERLLSHQIALSAHPACHNKLTELGLPRPSKQRIIAKGCVFYPAGDARLPHWLTQAQWQHQALQGWQQAKWDWLNRTAHSTQPLDATSSKAQMVLTERHEQCMVVPSQWLDAAQKKATDLKR